METPHDNVSEEDKKDTQVTSKLTRNSKSLTDDWGERRRLAAQTPPRAGWVCVSGGRCSVDKAGKRLHGRRCVRVRDGPGGEQSRRQRSRQCQGRGAGGRGGGIAAKLSEENLKALRE